MAFGDNFNDIGMFQQAGESYAVTSAAEEVKKAAKYVAPSYEENGVLNFKETFEKNDPEENLEE